VQASAAAQSTVFGVWVLAKGFCQACRQGKQTDGEQIDSMISKTNA
jgi:hypothetical protein